MQNGELTSWFHAKGEKTFQETGKETTTSHLLKKFLQQDSFPDSNLSVWALILALKSSFIQEDLFFKNERYKKKLQQNYKVRLFKIYILVVNYRRITNQIPEIKVF